MTDAHLQARLLAAETELLDAVSSNDIDIERFTRTFDVLTTDIFAQCNSGIQDDTASLAYAVAKRIQIVAESLMDLQSASSTLETSFLDEFDAIMADTDGDASSTTSRSSSPSLDDPGCNAHSPLSMSTPYIEAAYNWLIDNIHNPYPSPQTKERLARNGGVSIETISEWFTKARQRMGWTQVCAEHFNNCKDDMVLAAQRAYLDPAHCHHPEPLDQHMASIFVHLRSRAIELYSRKFRSSQLVKKLEPAVNRGVVGRVRIVRAKKHRKRKSLSPASDDGSFDGAACYPSPRSSTSTSPEPDVYSDDEESANDPEASSRKRRRSSSHPDRNKRPRFDYSLPSPTTSPESSPEREDAARMLPHDMSFATRLVPESAPTASRKRRLSDSDAGGAPKRPRGMPNLPRMHVVSDPLPASSAAMHDADVETWNVLANMFQNTGAMDFSLSAPAAFGALDEGAPLNVAWGSQLPTPPPTSPLEPLGELVVPMATLREMTPADFGLSAVEQPSSFDLEMSAFIAAYSPGAQQLPSYASGDAASPAFATPTSSASSPSDVQPLLDEGFGSLRSIGFPAADDPANSFGTGELNLAAFDGFDVARLLQSC